MLVNERLRPLIPTDLHDLSHHVLVWYEDAARDLPWRIGPAARRAGQRPDPYRIWLSEIMLQQTTIPHGTRYFLVFTQRWPTVADLAAASDEDVMAAWAGLGYYARARNLLKCARVVAERGGFPETSAELIKLPGIGPYTAGAIASIAFGEQAAAVDGNVERVMSRLLADGRDWAEVKARVRDVMPTLVPEDRPGEFAEAMMDLGATICTPKSPNCLICPVSKMCAARAEGDPARYPLKQKKAPKPKRRGAVLIAEADGNVAVVRRPEKGLLGGMLALPSTEWGEGAPDSEALLKQYGAKGAEKIGEVRHVFTHFELTLDVYRGGAVMGDGDWRLPADVDGLPSVFAKAFRLAHPLNAQKR